MGGHFEGLVNGILSNVAVWLTQVETAGGTLQCHTPIPGTKGIGVFWGYKTIQGIV